MSNVQVKNVEPELHEQLRDRAAAQGLTISEYVLQLIRNDLRRPTRSAWLATVARLPRHTIDRDDIAQAIAAGRDDR